MFVNIVVGLIVLSIVVSGFRKIYNDVKNNTCSCGSSCSDKSKCNKQ